MEYLSSLLCQATRLAAEAHDGALRKGGHLPYILHVMETAEIVATMTEDEDVLAAAVLHDVLEDHGDRYSLDALARAGFPEAVLRALRLLTHAEGVPYMDYVRALAQDPIARRVKLADLRHNTDVRRLNGTRPKKYDLYLQAIGYLQAQDTDPKTE